MNINSYIGKEIFAVVGDEFSDLDNIFLTENLSSLKTYLKSKSPVFDGELRVINGIISSVNFVPENTLNKPVFILIQDPQHKDKACCVELENNTKDITEGIERLLTFNDENNEEVVLPEFSDSISIDNIFIIYGKQLKTTISIDEDDIDEEVINSCKKIYKIIKNRGVDV